MPRSRGRERLSPRKSPVQPRSRDMTQALLEGAARVLAQHGAERFTTNHVAAAAGASIGSLYQYFPNKAALLAALHDRRAQMLWDEVDAVLADATRPPRERWIEVVHATFRAQRTDAALQRAMTEEGVEAREAPGFVALEGVAVARIAGFLAEAVPDRDAETHAERARYALVVITSLLARVAQGDLESEAIAAATADMLATHLGL